MSEIMPLRFVYLTLPTPTEPVLNVMVGHTFSQYRISREQLFQVNAQAADALVRGEIRSWAPQPSAAQLALPFEPDRTPLHEPSFRTEETP